MPEKNELRGRGKGGAKPLGSIDSIFRMALIAVILVALALGLMIVVPMTLRNDFAKPLKNYLEAQGHEDADGAYNMVCTASRQAITAEQFRSRLQDQLREIGEVHHIRALRGGRGVGSSVVSGDHKSVIVHTPMHREGGHWKPCPHAFPFDEIKPLT